MQGMKTRSPLKGRHEECKIMERQARTLSSIEGRGSPVIQFFMNDKGTLYYKLNPYMLIHWPLKMALKALQLLVELLSFFYSHLDFVAKSNCIDVQEV